MDERILCVDDDPAILSAYQRNLRRLGPAIDTAPSGSEGLRLLTAQGPYAVVVADMHMPGMDGVQFLTRVKEQAPDTVRMMLTGADDQRTAIQAVNEGSIFRFLSKPCPTEELAKALTAGLRQYRLVTAERELLEKTLAGSVRLLTEILGIIDTQSFSRAMGLRERIRSLCRSIAVTDTWEIEIAAMLAGIGHVAIPPMVTLKSRANKELTATEREMLVQIPQTGARLVANIPRLEGVSRIILYQGKHWDGTGFPADGVAGEAIPLGSRVLKLLQDLVQLEAVGQARAAVIGILRGRAGQYDPRLLEALASLGDDRPTEVRPPRQVQLHELRSGMVLHDDIQTNDGKVLIAAGHVVSETLIERLQNFARLVGLREPIAIVDQP